MSLPFQPAFVRSDRLLLLDTCGAESSIALAVGDEVLQQVYLPGRSASERLLETIAELLAAHDWRLSDLEAIAVAQGPGSFTGVRVGLSMAKAFAEGAKLSLLVLSRLEILASLPSPQPGSCFAVLDAGRGEIFWAQLERNAVLRQGLDRRETVLRSIHAAGFPVICEEALATVLSNCAVLPVPALSAASGLALARDRLAQGKLSDPLFEDALYLHRTEEETLQRQRQHLAAAPRTTQDLPTQDLPKKRARS